MSIVGVSCWAWAKIDLMIFVCVELFLGDRGSDEFYIDVNLGGKKGVGDL